jgi:hypothetical protein
LVGTPPVFTFDGWRVTRVVTDRRDRFTVKVKVHTFIITPEAIRVTPVTPPAWVNLGRSPFIIKLIRDLLNYVLDKVTGQGVTYLVRSPSSIFQSGPGGGDGVTYT